MIITAGSFKGRHVKTVQTHDVRPTSSKVRESIFNIIQTSIANSVMLDLFAGSGIMGLEAASRGAQKVFFVEKSLHVIRLLEENLGHFDIAHEIIRSDAIHALERFKPEYFDIIFIDPPYNSKLIELSLDKIVKHNLLKQDGVIILEHASTMDVHEKIDRNCFEIVKEKKYGDTSITIITGKS